MTAPVLSPWGCLVAAGVDPEDADWLLMQLPIIGYRDIPAAATVLARVAAVGQVLAADLMWLRTAQGVRRSPARAPLDELEAGATYDELRAALDEAEQIRLAEWGVVQR
ncbi:hypothetical protein HOU25_gp48 [Corynebacterium phage Juicebox]|uniref:Uncharacterized protein n=1 Tax=Corynebacterium phage Juicebox TaxID=2301600 RepID=A0A385UJS4_9CAUD|nr:hypothetical protein HOU25_gp48 [Corynebacterium phage Juicebox]AYB69477.1 hypothetical protein JUICEBOX_48 [Corynebacterium phage Juicebox]